jgi:ankyrin repeat protein
VLFVQVLLEGGATIELQDALGRSALMFAAGNGATAACQVRNAPLHHVHLLHVMMNGLLQSLCWGALQQQHAWYVGLCCSCCVWSCLCSDGLWRFEQRVGSLAASWPAAEVALSTTGLGTHHCPLHALLLLPPLLVPLLVPLLLLLLLLLQVLLDSAASLSARDRRGRAALDYAPAGEAVLFKSCAGRMLICCLCSCLCQHTKCCGVNQWPRVSGCHLL